VKITIKQIQGILISNLLIAGLTACSSEPAPWTRPDDSPWSEKHAAAESSVEDVAVIEEPVVIDEPEPYLEPVMIEEPVPVVAAVAVPEPDPVPTSPEEQIMAMDTGYAVQIYASSTMSSMDKFKSDYGLDEMLAVRTDRGGSVVYVLVRPTPDRSSANNVAAELEQITGTKPWVRAIAGLQKVVAQ
jgi:septal ring-binding cell division protein DamX